MRSLQSSERSDAVCETGLDPAFVGLAVCEGDRQEGNKPETSMKLLLMIVVMKEKDQGCHKE